MDKNRDIQLRDCLAASALAAIVPHALDHQQIEARKSLAMEYAELAYRMADAMLQARDASGSFQSK